MSFPFEKPNKKIGLTREEELNFQYPRDVNMAMLRNEPLVRHITKRMGITAAHNLYDDIIQDGLLGIRKACKTYKPARGRFSTHAAWPIRQAVAQAMRNDICVVDKSTRNWDTQFRRVALWTTTDDEGNSGLAYAGDFVGPNTTWTGSRDARALIVPALRCLNDREKYIITRFVVDGWTLARISNQFSICRERVRQLKENALTKLRRRIELDRIVERNQLRAS